ncbi:MAG: stage III sporulation protein AG, partial [Clostridia bacterium]|nr:stage III sporulation protein AG [Clostridia bacterium]
EYVIVDGDSGERGIVVRVAEPKIRGVAVVCKGADSETVRSRIVETVTALLDISSARVSVAKMS